MMQAPDTIKRLVETFGENIDSYRSGSYNEARVRVEFIDPMFKALGWDVGNEAGYAEAFKDVKTTMIYTHVLNRGPGGVRSPVDRL